MTVVDLGAGRGLVSEESVKSIRNLKTIKGKVEKVIGVDVDPTVRENETVDEALVIGENGVIPLPDESVDLIFSCATFEHVEDPHLLEREIFRILKPGGWICAWTVNKWGYLGIVARLVPNSLHSKVLPYVHPSSKRKERDVFPTYYRLNTIGQINRIFPPDRYFNASYYIPGPPSYNAGSLILAKLIRAYNYAVPDPLKKNLHVFLQKKPVSNGH